MTAQEAYTRILIDYPGFYASEAIDFGPFFMFQLRPIGIGKSEKYLTGTTYPIVSKKDGIVSEYRIVTDPDSYLSAKRVPIKNVFDKKLE